jgi:enoyl-CoA hydratase
MDYETLQVREENRILYVTLNRPEKLNAFNYMMIREFRALFQELYLRRDVRVVVLSAAGKAFSSGIDLSGATDPGEARQPGVLGSLDLQRSFADLVVHMRRCPQPIIATIQGPAVGLAFALLLACDVRIATPLARMNVAFVKIGLSGCDIGVSYFLPRLVGAAAASEFMLTGRFISADRAKELNLVTKIVAQEDLEAEARAYANDMLRVSPLGLRLTKEALNFALDAPSLEAAIAMEDRNQVMLSGGADHMEGIRSVLEKRDPVWTQG